jgi:hypothetical protein
MAEQEKKTMVEEEKQEKKSFEELFNKRERLKVIKQGILSYLTRVGDSQRQTISDKLNDLQIAENPYELYRGGNSKKVLLNPTNEEIGYCLNYLKNNELIDFDEKRKRWLIKPQSEAKKKMTLDNFLQ